MTQPKSRKDTAMLKNVLQKVRDPNLAGELLRHLTFVPDPNGSIHGYRGDYGCVGTFDLTPDFEPLKPRTPIACGASIALARAILNGDTPDDPIDPNGWADRPTSWDTLQLHSNGTIHVGWYWDDDGTLAYIVGKILLVNDNCKKDDWRALPTLEPRLLDAGPWHRPKTTPPQYLEDPLFGPFNETLLSWAGQGDSAIEPMSRIILAACKENPDASVLQRYGYGRSNKRASSITRR